MSVSVVHRLRCISVGTNNSDAPVAEHTNQPGKIVG